ncbi:MAG TPA: secretin N-terminal domain-containing protein [Acidobacteriaceae bacterium]|nr:secretin N-terminal domain-containing protein [Acidobacteriaceae bacterium]
MKNCILKWAPSAALIFVLGLFLFGSTPNVQAKGQSAKKLYKAGQIAEARNDIEAAYQNYYQAYQEKPEDLRYKTAYERVRFDAAALLVSRGETLRSQGDMTGALTEFLRALQIDPSNDLARQEIRATRRAALNKSGKQQTGNGGPQVPSAEVREMGDMGGPVHLKPLSNEPLTLHMVEDSKIVYQTVGKAAGINVLFDPDYTSKRIQVDLTNTNLYDTLRIIGMISDTFWEPITPNTIFVAQNNRVKRTELQQQAVQTFYLTNVSQQNDFTDIQTALRNMFQTAKIYGVASQNAIIMRGTPDELLLAQKLIDDLDKPKPEVVLDIAVLEVSRNYERNIGIQLPQTASVAFQASNTSSSSSSSSTSSSSSSTTPTSNGLTLNSLAHLNANNFAVTIGQAQANLLLTNSTTKILQNPKIRVLDGQEATLKIGERIPVATGSYQTGAATAIVSSLVNTQFQYLDVGVNIKVKPTIHYDGDVTLKLDIGVSSQNGNTNIGGITEPIITQRTVSQTIRLRNGEANILGGILQRQTSETEAGTPGLANLPILKYIFGDNDKTQTDDQIVFLLIPHIVRREMLSPTNLREIDSGTANRIQLRYLNNESVKAALSSQAAPAGATSVVPSLAGAPATAAGAAAAAVTNMQQQASSAAPVQLKLAPEMQQAKVGSTFQVKVNLVGGLDVFSVPMQMQYDQTKLSLINVDLGDSQPGAGMDFLGKDGQAVALVHRDAGDGNVAISASRPPGANGVSGSGTVCVLTFKATAPGPAAVVITRPVVRNSAQQAIPATGSRAIVQIQP